MSARPFDLGKLDVDAIRYKKRRKLLLFSLPILIVVMLASLKLLTMTGGGAIGSSLYNSGDSEGARRSFSITALLNIIEPYKSPFNSGTAELRMQKYDDAERHLLASLETVPVDKICLVRINLSLVYEGKADQLMSKNELGKAIEQYSKARETVVGDNCTKDPGQDANVAAKDGNAIDKPQARRRAAAVQERVESKTVDAKRKENNDTRSPDAKNKTDSAKNDVSKKPDQSSIDKLKDQQQQSEQKRRNSARNRQNSKDYEKNTGRYSYDEARW